MQKTLGFNLMSPVRRNINERYRYPVGNRARLPHRQKEVTLMKDLIGLILTGLIIAALFVYVRNNYQR